MSKQTLMRLTYGTITGLIVMVMTLLLVQTFTKSQASSIATTNLTHDVSVDTSQIPSNTELEQVDASLIAQAVNPAAPEAVTDIFQRAGCVNCHRIAGITAATGTIGPDLSSIGVDAANRIEGYDAERYLREAILTPNAFIAPTCPNGPCPEGVMLQAFAQTLSEAELDLIVDFLLSLGTSDSLTASTTSRQALEVSLPAESVLLPFAALPRAAASEAQIALGKYLFFDSRLSGNGSRSCASCHNPDYAFAGSEALSQGYPSTAYFRNTPTLLNTAFAERLYWDGRLSGADMPTLVRDHITEAHFMSNDGRLMVERLNQVPEYGDLFELAFGGGPSFGRVLNAISAYVNSLNSPPGDYDAYLAGDSEALSAEAQAGLELFEGKAGCASCHSGATLSDYDYYNIGVATDAAMLTNPERHLTFRRFFSVLGTPNYRNLTEDVGQYALTIDEADWAKFRTPSLREVGRTAPYMHNGSLASLPEVLAFYNAGGGSGQSAGLSPLGLSETEISQLLAFLESLSSEAVTVTVPDLPVYQVLEVGDQAKIFAMIEAASAEIPISDVVQDYPPLGPLPELSGPADNPITPAKVELGRLLFFDPRMSADGSMSCNSCHPSSTGWGAATAISFGGPGSSHWRNAQTILNSGYYSKLNWDGARGSIEKQNKGAWGGAVAGNLDGMLANERLAQIPDYVARFQEVFGVEQPSMHYALLAVASYQRTINSQNVPFDAFLGGDAEAISDEAKRGYELFTGPANCIACHNGALVSDDSYHATGVPQHPDFLDNPLKQITFRYEQWAKGAPLEIYENASDDLGLYYVSKQLRDIGKFRTPSLRDVCYTAPYMHNGVFGTLSEVIDFYNAGAGEHPNKDPVLTELNLDASQQQDLLAFLESLCGDTIQDVIPELAPYADLISEEN